jgi:hypothetical protein
MFSNKNWSRKFNEVVEEINQKVKSKHGGQQGPIALGSAADRIQKSCVAARFKAPNIFSILFIFFYI